MSCNLFCLFLSKVQTSSLGHVLHDNLEGEEIPSSQQDEAEVTTMAHLDDTLIFAEKLELNGHVEDDAPAWYRKT